LYLRRLIPGSGSLKAAGGTALAPQRGSELLESRKPAEFSRFRSMFSLFKRRQKPETLTFKTRVAEFWRWFAKNADRFYATIEDKRCRDLQPEVTKQMNLLTPGGGAWVFGPGANDIGHSFTFTGEGNPDQQLLAAYWLSQAPSLPGWTFYSSKQRSTDIKGYKIRFNELEFDPLEFWLTAYVDEQEEQIDLVVWHPSFSKMEERARWMAIFLYLDEVLGELGTQSWIGEIKVSDDRLADAMPLTEFAAFVDRVVADHDWKLSTPGVMWHSYELKEIGSGPLRSDIIAGSTCLFPLIQSIKDGHVDPDPLAKTGAEYVYIVLPKSALTPGQEVASRGIIEEALESAFEGKSAGRLLGGAIGRDHAYIDLLLWDGANSLKIVEEVLRKQGLGAGSSIEYFALSRAGERIAL
jgi:hypothetical protein